MRTHLEGAVRGSTQAERGYQLPRCLIGGYDGAQNHQISPPAFLLPTGRLPCGCGDISTLPLLD
jgi:hypothetical protein